MAFGCAAVSAIQPVAIRFGALRLDPLTFAAAATAVAALCTVPMLYARGELHELVDRRYRTRLATLSMLGTAGTALTLIYGLRKIDAVAGVLLLQVEPIYSLMIATVFAGERPSVLQIGATLTIIAGIVSTIGTGEPFSPAYAAGLILLTPLLWQCAHALSLSVMPPLSPICMTGARYIYAAVALLIVAAARHPALAQLATLPAIIAIAGTGLCGFAGSLTWYVAINRLSLAWTTALVVPAVPMLTVVFAMVLLGEHTSARELGGIAISIAGVLALITSTRGERIPRPRVPSAAAMQSRPPASVGPV